MHQNMHPVVSMTDKPWGRNRHLLQQPHNELHHATIKPGGYSSRHKHDSKINYFYVVSGNLWVEFFADGESTEAISSLYLGSTDRVAVPAGQWHRFVNTDKEDVELIEMYWSSPIHEDIVRADVGGVDPSLIT